MVIMDLYLCFSVARLCNHIYSCELEQMLVDLNRQLNIYCYYWNFGMYGREHFCAFFDIFFVALEIMLHFIVEI